MQSWETDTDGSSEMNTSMMRVYDYSDYYSAEPGTIPEPCSNHNVKEFGSWFLPTLYSLVFIIGLIGNGLVVCVLIKYKKLRNMTDVYLLNLAISDLLFVFSLPFWSHYAAMAEWVFGGFLCKAITGFYLMGFYAGVFFIMIMTVDRYLAVVHAVAAVKLRSVTLGLVVSMVTWMISFCASFPTIMFSKIKNESGALTCKSEFPEMQRDNWKLITNFEVNIVGLIIPFSVMIFCYSFILQTLKRCRNDKKAKAIRLIFLVVIVYFIFWAPYNIVIFLQSLMTLGYLQHCASIRYMGYAMQLTETFSFIHCCLNPVIYAFVGQEFKKSVRRLLHQWSSKCFSCKQCMMFVTERPDMGSSTYSRSSTDMHETRLI
ncbi:C-C chemokine receptor type 4 [Amia ocellicauda]|uniref:C-C chemokine receptor type 4 n=1 Tax=Amia ocellicauda TaxID=2972642 RepID=UPI003464C87C